MTTEGPTGDLLKRMLAAITAASARQGVERLVEDARGQAEAEVVELVKSAMKASLLREVVRHMESGALDVDQGGDEEAVAAVRAREDSEMGRQGDEEVFGDEGPGSSITACYVYAIARDLPEDWTPDVPAIDPGFELGTVRHDGLRAVVSEVPLDAFNQTALDQRTGDREWVETKVRAHDEVVKAVAAAATTIPCRFCTVVRGAGEVRSLLATHYRQIEETLSKLDGRGEWGVRISFDPVAVAAREAAAPEEPSGKEYLRQRKRRDADRAESQRRARELAQECHSALAGVAEDAALLSPRSGQVPVVELINAAYLVPVDRVVRFHDVVEELRDRHGPYGLEITVTGPWPAYNFARLDLSLEAAA